MSLNIVVLIGRLVKDSELRYTPNGKAVATFTLAVDNPYKKGEADFINVVTWGKTGENVATYTRKGSLVAVEGRISTRNYEKDGRKVYVTEVVADNVRFLDSKKKEPSEPSPFDDSPIDIDLEDTPF